MVTNIEKNEFSFLMNDAEFTDLAKELQRRQNKIEKHTEIIETKKFAFDRYIDEVCKVLFSNIALLFEYQKEHGEIRIHNLKDYHVKQVGSSSIKVSYDLTYGESATVSVCEYDSYDGREGSDIITFPLNFIHRADWVAKLDILKEAIALKKQRIEEEKAKKLEAATKQKELETLQLLLEKYKDEIKI